MRFKNLLFSISLVIAFSFNCIAQTIIKANNPHIRYEGRIAMTDSTAELSWTASSLKINFTGTGVNALLKDERADNYYNIIVDDKVVSILHPDQTKKVYTLASGL